MGVPGLGRGKRELWFLPSTGLTPHRLPPYLLCKGGSLPAAPSGKDQGQTLPHTSLASPPPSPPPPSTHWVGSNAARSNAAQTEPHLAGETGRT